MRVCHVITKPELGGAQLSTLNILSKLPRDKYDISIITSPRGILAPEFRDSGARCVFSPFLDRTINPLLDILALIHILLIYIRLKPHAVHTHSSKAGIIGRCAAWIARVRIIVHTVHGWSFNDYQPLVLKRFFIFLERVTARFTTRIICVSKRDIEIALRYKIAPKEKFVYIKYGISFSDYSRKIRDPIKKKRELGITNDGPVIGMVACLKPQKAPLDYIKASIKIYAEMPNVNFLLIGDGVLKKRCKNFLATSVLNGRFIFTGWRRDVSEIFDILDIAVLTSKWEGMPISIIEALRKGCPVVATNAGGTPELVKDGTAGYVAEVGAYRDVAEKVLRILNDAQLFNKMKREAHLSIDSSFEAARMVNEVENLYRRLI